MIFKKKLQFFKQEEMEEEAQTKTRKVSVGF